MLQLKKKNLKSIKKCHWINIFKYTMTSQLMTSQFSHQFLKTQPNNSLKIFSPNKGTQTS